MIFALLILGAFTAVSSGCNIAILAALTGYAGVRKNNSKYDSLFTSLGFMTGTILIMTLSGALIGYAGEMISKSLSLYGKIFAGFVTIFFGLMALNLVPFQIKVKSFPFTKKHRGISGAILFGTALGGASITCCLSCCSPALLIALGVSGIQGEGLRSALLMGIFAVGYSIPLAVLLLGISFGKLAFRAGRIISIIKIPAGLLLVGTGFYFLLSL
jgi:cytochrome c biogenesis protein CcdA